MNKRLIFLLFTSIVFQLISINVSALSFANTLIENTDSLRQLKALEKLSRIKLSGYIQAQFQYADSSGQQTFNGGNFPVGVDKRFAVRRGRLKVQYDSKPLAKGWSFSQYVLQVDVTEKGISLKDAYIKLTDPWMGWLNLTTGMQNRPFGYEISYSSSLRESPERGRMSQIIFPGERDLGMMLTIQAPKSSQWNFIKVDAGMFNGTGVRNAGLDASDFDKIKDFIGRASVKKSILNERLSYEVGVSYYYGGFRIDTVGVYKTGVDVNGVKGFIQQYKKSDFYSVPLSNRKQAYRKYYGLDAQLSINWLPGITTIRCEYITGEQPGFLSTTASPAAINNADIYKRKFNGAYLYLLQNVGQTPLQAIIKYDWYDPNTEVKNSDIGRSVVSGKTFNATDLRYDTWGVGLAYRCDENIKITAYYDIVKNEKSANLSGYQKDLKDNLFTLRIQAKF